MKDWFATKLQTNAVLCIFVLTLLQAYILWELNGQLAPILISGCPNPLVIATIFGPTGAIIWIAKAFTSRSTNFPEEPKKKSEDQ